MTPCASNWHSRARFAKSPRGPPMRGDCRFTTERTTYWRTSKAKYLRGVSTFVSSMNIVVLICGASRRQESTAVCGRWRVLTRQYVKHLEDQDRMARYGGAQRKPLESTSTWLDARLKRANFLTRRTGLETREATPATFVDWQILSAGLDDKISISNVNSRIFIKHNGWKDKVTFLKKHRKLAD